jgi:hypothetical protein
MRGKIFWHPKTIFLQHVVMFTRPTRKKEEEKVTPASKVEGA